MQKVFGIGLSRTGTTSLNTAFRMLGYQSKHYPTSLHDFDTHDAATDATVAMRYKYLDEKYDAKFILTIRDVKAWLRSIEWLFNDCAVLDRLEEEYRELVSSTRMTLYGVDYYDPVALECAYHKHVNEVTTYFQNRSDFLVMDICNGDGWDKLCPFLGLKTPKAAFPNLNASKISQ